MRRENRDRLAWIRRMVIKKNAKFIASIVRVHLRWKLQIIIKQKQNIIRGSSPSSSRKSLLLYMRVREGEYTRMRDLERSLHKLWLGSVKTSSFSTPARRKLHVHRTFLETENQAGNLFYFNEIEFWMQHNCNESKHREQERYVCGLANAKHVWNWSYVRKGTLDHVEKDWNSIVIRSFHSFWIWINQKLLNKFWFDLGIMDL